MRTVIVTGLLICLSSHVSAQSLRYFGTGTNDIDRVKISIDPHVPADVGATDFTIELWLRAASGNNQGAVSCNTTGYNWFEGNIVLDRDRLPNNVRDYGLAIADGRVVFGVEPTNGNSYSICSTSRVLDGAWHHVAVQRRRSDGWLWIFLDGQLQAQANGPDGDLSYPNGVTPQDPREPLLVIGAEKYDLNAQLYPGFRGWIDELRLSNTLRYSGNFTRPAVAFQTDPQTAALYHFDEGGGDAITDSVGQSPGVRRVGGSQMGPQWSQETPFTGGAPTDTQAPTVPSNVQGSASSPTRVDLTWNSSSDNVGVTSYRVLRNGSTSLTTMGTSYSDTSAASNTTYTYTVSAVDAAGNRSLESTAVQVTTPPAPTQTYRVRQTTTGFRVRQVYTGSGGVRGSAMSIPGAYGQATSVYIDAGNASSLPTCDPNNTVTSNGTVYMAVTAPAVSQHGLSILGQTVTGYVGACDLQ